LACCLAVAPRARRRLAALLDNRSPAAPHAHVIAQRGRAAATDVDQALVDLDAAPDLQAQLGQGGGGIATQHDASVDALQSGETLGLRAQAGLKGRGQLHLALHAQAAFATVERLQPNQADSVSLQLQSHPTVREVHPQDRL